MKEAASLQVYKFGGASVKDAKGILNVRHIVGAAAPGQLLLVVSAMGKTTNALEEIFNLAYAGESYAAKVTTLKESHFAAAAALSQEFPSTESGPVLRLYEDFYELFQNLDLQLAEVSSQRDYDKQYDQLVPLGELLASRLVALALCIDHPQTEWLDCRPLIRTDKTWREGQVNWTATEAAIRAALPALLGKGPVVTQGFLGGTASGATTTLGREGSDYSAAIFAYCLGAGSVTIWKDVAGLLNADPKIFPDTIRYPEISYQETIEMAYYGASVIHPKTLKPLAERGIPLYVKSFLEPAAAGTLIHDCRHGQLAPAFIRKTGQCLVSFESKDFAFISEENLEVIFGALAQARLKINLMQNSAISFSVCLDYNERRLSELLALLREQFAIHYNTDLTLFTIKNYDTASVQQLTAGRQLLLEQRTRQTFQVVCTADGAA